MTRYFVTGATGFIGKKLIWKLISQNRYVHILVRSTSNVSDLKHRNITVFEGDITDKESVERAMQGCTYVIHLAAYAKIWPGNKDIFERVNFNGTIHVVETAIACKVEKIILVSTAGVFGPSVKNKSINEDSIREMQYFNYYEETKDLTDKYVFRHYASKINLSIVCPTRVYGPGLLNDSNSVTRLIKTFYKRKNIFLPGNGKDIGNYVYIDNVVDGILLALESPIKSERFILGGENTSFDEIFDLLEEHTGISYRKIHIPVQVINIFAYVFLILGKLKLITPPIIPAWTRRYFYDWQISTRKAEQQLGYEPILLTEGLKNTIEWLEANRTNNEAANSVNC